MSEFEEEPEIEEPELSPVPHTWIGPGTNPNANRWYEYYEADDDPNSGTLGIEGFYLTMDTSPVPGKTYYYAEGVSVMSETANAYSTYQTYLMYRTTSSGSYAKLIDIKDYPDMVPSPNMIDVTTLSDGMEKQIPGIIRLSDGYQFTANYTATNYQTVKNLEGHQYDYALYLGGTTSGEPDGSQGVFKWTGDVRAGFTGKGVDDARDMTVTCTPSTDVTWSASAGT